MNTHQQVTIEVHNWDKAIKLQGSQTHTNSMVFKAPEYNILRPQVMKVCIGCQKTGLVCLREAWYSIESYMYNDELCFAAFIVFRVRFQHLHYTLQRMLKSSVKRSWNVWNESDFEEHCSESLQQQSFQWHSYDKWKIPCWPGLAAIRGRLPSCHRYKISKSRRSTCNCFNEIIGPCKWSKEM